MPIRISQEETIQEESDDSKDINVDNSVDNESKCSNIETHQTTSGNKKPSPREPWSSDEYWTMAAIEEELLFELSSALTYTIDKDAGTIHIRNKYYEQAEFNLYRMNVWNPPPEFVINRSDLSPKLLSELANLYKSYPKKFEKVVTNIVCIILETINHRYFHLHNIAAKVIWSFAS